MPSTRLAVAVALLATPLALGAAPAHADPACTTAECVAEDRGVVADWSLWTYWTSCHNTLATVQCPGEADTVAVGLAGAVRG